MRVRLGYVAISRTINESYCHTMTYTTFKKLKVEERKDKWEQIVQENLKNLLLLLKYNVQNKILFFRISPTLIPLATHKEMTFDYIEPFQKEWKKIGDYIRKHHLRVDFHPNQFCLLNSAKEDYFDKALDILIYLKKIMDAMGISGKLILHVGSREGGKEEALKRFKRNFFQIDEDIRKLIVLENDDKSYNVEETLQLCMELQVPMVLDFLHAWCLPSPKPLKDYFPLILKTWEKETLPPKMHLSSSLDNVHKWYHNDYIKWKDFQKCYAYLEDAHQDIDIMIEAKAYEEAVLRLRRQIKFYLPSSPICFE